MRQQNKLPMVPLSCIMMVSTKSDRGQKNGHPAVPGHRRSSADRGACGIPAGRRHSTGCFAGALPCPGAHQSPAPAVAAPAVRAAGRSTDGRPLRLAVYRRGAADRLRIALHRNRAGGKPLHRPSQHHLCPGGRAAPCHRPDRLPAGGGDPIGRGAHCRHTDHYRGGKRGRHPAAFRRSGAKGPAADRRAGGRKLLPFGVAAAAAPPNHRTTKCTGRGRKRRFGRRHADCRYR